MSVWLPRTEPVTRAVLFHVFCCLSGIVIAFAAFRIAASRSDQLGSIGVFASFWGSGWALSNGLDPYAPTPFTPTFGSASIPLSEINLNPPLLLPLFQLLARLDIGPAVQLTTVLSVLAFVVCAGHAVLTGREMQARKVAWLFLLPFFYDTIYLGQIYILFFVLSTIACHQLAARRPGPAGLAIGAMVACRPTFALWIAMLWLAGHRRVSRAAAGTATVLTLLSIAAYGPATFLHWLSALAQDRHAWVGTNASLNGYFARLGSPGLGLAAGVLVAGVACAWALRMKGGALQTTLVALAASMAASPLSWADYAVLLVPALLATRWDPLLSGAAALLCLPLQIPLAESLDRGWTGALCCAAYPLALLVIAGSAMRHRGGTPARARPNARAATTSSLPSAPSPGPVAARLGSRAHP